jgi:tRNA (guanine-N7-)-methyltransferase
MFANSRAVESNQHAPHRRLREIVSRHLHIPYQRTPSDAGKQALATIMDRLHEPFILDAGCGTGLSTLALARTFPASLVLGIDKSKVRLGRGWRALAEPDAPRNAILLHCELVDFWQLAFAGRLRCERQYLLYPNPWPKAEQLKRRWHAHPIFPAILALGGALELRTNWRIYAEEFVQALTIADVAADIYSFVPDEPLTPFERKYAESKHNLWRVKSSTSLPLAAEAGARQRDGEGGA